MTKNAKPKYYVVWKGVKPGIYTSWKECEAQVRGYPDARYKGFATRTEAEAAFAAGTPSRTGQSAKQKDRTAPHAGQGRIIRDSISVDAACSGNPGRMEYRGVRTATGDELFHMGPFAQGTNNIGEFLAIVHALALLRKKGDESTPVYTDSRTALSWIRARKARTKLERTRQNAELFDLIRRAEEWLANHTWKNSLLKWETENWGEIPADFGRK